MTDWQRIKGMQKCTRCNQVKPVDQFEISKVRKYTREDGKEITQNFRRRTCIECSGSPDGIRYTCRSCGRLLPVDQFDKVKRRSMRKTSDTPRLDYCWCCKKCTETTRQAEIRRKERLKAERAQPGYIPPSQKKALKREQREARLDAKMYEAERRGISYGQLQAMKRREEMKLAAKYKALQDMP